VNSGRKLYRNLVEAVILALVEIEEQGRYADKVLEKVLKSNPKWGARDRGFIAETVYDVVRYKRLLEHLSAKVVSSGHPSVADAVAVYLVQQGYEIPHWPIFERVFPLSSEKINHEITQISSEAVLHAYPDWLYERMEQELGQVRWAQESVYLNQPAEVYLRVNTLKVAPRKLQSLLEEEGIIAELIEPWVTLRLLRRQNVFKSKYFKLGYFEVQDQSSQHVAIALEVEPGMRVIDACAGAGGKTLHLGALMKNKGKIIAMDTEEWKLKKLMERANRAGISIIEPRLIDSAKAIKRLHDSADRLLTDVPCSGLGVLRRNPDTKWKLTAEAIERTRNIQQDILQHYSAMLRKGSRMVYATCSILPSENEQQVQAFLDQHKDFAVKDMRTIYASESNADGFFIASLTN
jgi:16S rRNA (cytosine967-C5)-methyltransferase